MTASFLSWIVIQGKSDKQKPLSFHLFIAIDPLHNIGLQTFGQPKPIQHRSIAYFTKATIVFSPNTLTYWCCVNSSKQLFLANHFVFCFQEIIGSLLSVSFICCPKDRPRSQFWGTSCPDSWRSSPPSWGRKRTANRYWVLSWISSGWHALCCAWGRWVSCGGK